VTIRLTLPRADGSTYAYDVQGGSSFAPPESPLASRVAFAAAHVVADPLAEQGPAHPPAIDWDATLAYRRHLWSYGLAVAEAMDTAQRGMGLDWATARELIGLSAADAAAVGGRIACGAGTDQLAPGPSVTVEDVVHAYEEQCAFIEASGSAVILMASRALAACARGPDDYAAVYDRVLTQVSSPVILHWLGDMFDPALAGYWGSSDVEEAMRTCLDVMRRHEARIDGIKISLLDAGREIDMRRRLPASIRMYTGDDFHYPELIAGDQHGHSDALLGIFDAIAPAASAAIARLDAGDALGFRAILEPTVALSRHIFQAPTFHYKTGIVFLAYLAGHQSHFRMIHGQESARSVVHLSELLVLADRAGLVGDAERAATRMRPVLALAGVT
jgi:hypothetical protein